MRDQSWIMLLGYSCVLEYKIFGYMYVAFCKLILYKFYKLNVISIYDYVM